MKTNKPPALPQTKRDYANRSWALKHKSHKIHIIIAILALILAVVAQTAFAEGNGWIPAKNPDDGFIYVCTNGMTYHSPVDTEKLPDKDLCTALLDYRNRMLVIKSEANRTANFERIKNEVFTDKK